MFGKRLIWLAAALELPAALFLGHRPIRIDSDARPAVTSVILGARTTGQLADNLAAADLRLTAGETERLTEVSRPRVGVYPYGPMAQEQRSRKLEGGR